MPLHIKDPAATEAVRRLAAERRVSLTEAVRAACAEALDRDARAKPITERVAPILARLDALPPTGERADKAFFDAEWNDAP
ncbi:MAG: type II toxin-antitoxin system VapB family antitoxin [Roseiarcus sp.]